MHNKIFIPPTSLNTKAIDIKNEIAEIRKILDKIESEVHGKPVNETCRKLIKNSMKKASGFLEGTINIKKFSDLDKRK